MAGPFDAIQNIIDVDHIQRSVRLMVVGGGRFGWWFILMALAHGVRWVRLIEPDWTERRNYASGFPESAVGTPKIAYVREELARRSSRISFEGAAVHLSARNRSVFEEWLHQCTHLALFIDSFDVATDLARAAYG